MDGDVTVASDPLLAALDDDQRVVAEALIGPVCVLAGDRKSTPLNSSHSIQSRMPSYA